jgi:hypothetical protein
LFNLAKVRGFKKLGWLGLYWGGFLLGGIVESLFMGYAMPTPMALAGLLPVWVVFAVFRYRTRNLPDVESGAQSVGFALGKRFKALRNGSK